MTPRKKLTATSYSIYAKTAENVAWLNISGMPAEFADGVDNTGGSVNQVDSGEGLTGGPITDSGTLAIDTSVVPRLGEMNVFTNGQVIQNTVAAVQGLTVQGASGQAASLQEWQDSTGAAVASLSAGGAVVAASFSGNGYWLTALNADNLSSGIVQPSRGGTGLDTSSTASGSMLYTSASGTWSALPKGTDGEVLKLSGGVPTWAAASSSGGTVTQVDTGTGLTGGPITDTGTLAIDTSVVPRLGEMNVFTNGQMIQNASAGLQGLIVQGTTGQAASLQEWQDSTGAPVATLSAGGAIIAASFSGSGYFLTDVNAAQLDSFDTAQTFSTAQHIYVSRADGKMPAGTVDSVSIDDVTRKIVIPSYELDPGISVNQPPKTSVGISPALAFDDIGGNDEILFSLMVPDDWSGNGDLDLSIVWSTNASSGSAIWDAEFIATSDDENVDSVGTGLTAVISPASPTVNGRITAGPITIPGPSLAAGDLVSVRLYRDGSNALDTLNGSDANLHMVYISYNAIR